MEREYFFVAGVSMCWLLAFAAAGASAAVALPFEDDFENIAVGDYPDENGWQNMFSGKNALVSDTMAHSGSKSFRLESYAIWSRTDLVRIQGIPDRISYEVSIYPDPAPGRAVRIGFSHGSGNQCQFYNLFSIYNADGSNGTVHFKGPADITATEVGRFLIGHWVTVRADLDYTMCTARIWLDGEIAARGVPILPKEFDDPSYGHVVLNKFGVTEYNWPGSNTGVIYIDDVRISGGQTIDRRMPPSNSRNKSDAKIAAGAMIAQTDQRKVTFVSRGTSSIDLLNHHNEYGKPVHKDITLEFAFGEAKTGALVYLRSSKFHPLIHGWFIVLGDELFPFKKSREGTSKNGQYFSFTLADEDGSAQGGKGESATLVYGESERHVSPMRDNELRSLTDKLRSKRAVVHDDPPIITRGHFITQICV